MVVVVVVVVVVVEVVVVVDVVVVMVVVGGVGTPSVVHSTGPLQSPPSKLNAKQLKFTGPHPPSQMLSPK